MLGNLRCHTSGPQRCRENSKNMCSWSLTRVWLGKSIQHLYTQYKIISAHLTHTFRKAWRQALRTSTYTRTRTHTHTHIRRRSLGLRQLCGLSLRDWYCGLLLLITLLQIVNWQLRVLKTIKVLLHSQELWIFQVLSLSRCLHFLPGNLIWPTSTVAVSGSSSEEFPKNRFVGCSAHHFPCCCLRRHPTRDITTVSSATSDSPNQPWKKHKNVST